MSALLKSVQAAILGGREVSLYELLYTLKLQGELNPALERAVVTLLVLEACERQGLSATEQEVQAEQDAIRRELGLVRAADTRLWLRREGLSEEELAECAERRALVAKLRASATADIDQYYETHRDDFAFTQLTPARRPEVAEAMWNRWLSEEAERRSAMLTLPTDIHR